MSPGLKPGDHVLVDKGAYSNTPPRRGDLIVFTRPDGRLLKRVAAIAGDEIAVEDGVLVVNQQAVPEPAIHQTEIDGRYYGPVTVPAGSVFVLGDNRANSIDSRTFGTVALIDVVGRVTYRLWPSPGQCDR